MPMIKGIEKEQSPIIPLKAIFCIFGFVIVSSNGRIDGRTKMKPGNNTSYKPELPFLLIFSSSPTINSEPIKIKTPANTKKIDNWIKILAIRKISLIWNLKTPAME